MILPGFIRKLLAVFRGSVAPPLILLSVMIGFWVGLMPGWSGLHTALLVVVLILNIHLGLFLLSLGVGKAGAWRRPLALSCGHLRPGPPVRSAERGVVDPVVA